MLACPARMLQRRALGATDGAACRSAEHVARCIGAPPDNQRRNCHRRVVLAAFAPILPFVRPEGQDGHTTIFSLSQEPDSFYRTDPEKILDLLAAVVGDAEPGSVFSLGSALSRLQSIAPDLATTRKFQKLAIAASPHV
jgi:hypothetical protein